MSSLITGDLHLTALPRDSYRHAFQKSLRAMIRDQGVHSVVILGDLCDDKDEHPAWLVNAVVDHLVALVKLVPVFVLKGNHDYLSVDHPYWRFLRHVDGVTWIEEPTAMMLPGLEKNKCLFLPHTRDAVRDWGKVNGYNYVFAHNTFEGAVSEGGFRLPGIPIDYFHDWQRVISGDIHKPQKLAKNFYYVGAPYRIDFGDDFDPRMLVISDDEVKSISCGGPQKVLINAPCKDAGSLVRRGDMVKVRVRMQPGDFANWAETRRRWANWAEKTGVDLWKVEPDIVREPNTRGGLSVIQGGRVRQSDEEMTRRYGRARGADKSTIKTGLTLIEE